MPGGTSQRPHSPRSLTPDAQPRRLSRRARFAVTGDSVVCAGYDGAGCGGYAERTTNLPSDAAAYRAAAAEMNAIVALAPGDKVLVGLSGHVTAM